MNEQQLQQILTIQQAIAAAATAAVINSLLNPQQAAGLANANALTDLANADLQQQQQQQQQQHHHQDSNRQSPTNHTSPTSTPTLAPNVECNTRIQDLLMQLQQQASLNNVHSPVALNLNLTQQQQQSLASPLSSSRSPVSGSRLAAAVAQELSINSATTSNIPLQQANNNNQASPIKKLKTRHHQHHQNQLSQHHLQQQQTAFHIRSSEATSKPQHSSPKSTHSTSSISSLNNSSSKNNLSSSASSSAPFISNNVGLPRKLVRGQDVWLGRGAEQTRQILKCMWCGQSFRTLAEMTQHMKITQHYTNIISQEQITSWRQPESSEASNNKHSNKQSTQVNSSDDNHDERLSEKFNDSDREDSFSNDGDDDDDDDDDNDQHEEHNLSKQHQTSSRNLLIEQNKSDSFDINNSSVNNDSNNGFHSSPEAKTKSSPNSKPLTRSSRKRFDSIPSQQARDDAGRESSSATSSSSQLRNSGSSVNLILGDLNQESEINKGNKQLNGLKQESSSPEAETNTDENDENSEISKVENSKCNEKLEVEEKLKELPTDESKAVDDDTSARKDEDSCTHDEENDENDADTDTAGDNGDDQRSETNESAATTTTSGGAKISSLGSKGDTGDPLSALETMVEKSFDPRMRPGVANGGILQRLGIDEEVCPPWQHINYANWYAAAAYGHPMAAALLAAGINLQNGIKLSKNVNPKKNED